MKGNKMNEQIIITIKGGILLPNNKVQWGPEKRANSFVLNFLKSLAFCMGSIDTQPVNDQGTAGTPGRNAGWWTVNAANDRYHGIWIGTGNTAVTRSQYNLATPITTGYTCYLTQISLSEVGTNTHRISITREIKNTSGGTWDLKEVCLFIVGYFGTNWYAFMIERSLYELTVYNGNTCRYEYQINVTLP